MDCQYSCNFWTTNYENAVKMYQDRLIDAYRETFVSYEYIINGKTYPFEAYLEYTNLELNPDYTDQENLQKGNLFSVDMSFVVWANVLYGKGVQLSKTPLYPHNWTPEDQTNNLPSDGAVYQMFYDNQIDDLPNMQETTQDGTEVERTHD